jgi:hypothetical protein
MWKTVCETRCDSARNMPGVHACFSLTGPQSLNVVMNGVIRSSLRLPRYSQNIRVHELTCQRGDRK